MSQLSMTTTRKKLSHLLPRSRHHPHSTSMDGDTSVHQKNFKQRLIALIKKFRTDGNDFGNEEQYREALERELLKVAASRGPTTIEDLLEEDMDGEEESSIELDGIDNQQSPHLSSQGSSLRLDLKEQQASEQTNQQQNQQQHDQLTHAHAQTSQQQPQSSSSQIIQQPQTSQHHHYQQQHHQQPTHSLSTSQQQQPTNSQQQSSSSSSNNQQQISQQTTQNDDQKCQKDAQQSKKKSNKRHSHLPISQLQTTTRKKLSHLLPRHHHRSKTIDGVSSVHQKNFKQRLVALIKKFRTDGSNFDNEEQYREALERELLKVATGRGSRAIEELLEEEIDAEEESGSEVDGWDNISETSTPKPSLRPFFSSTTLDKI